MLTLFFIPVAYSNEFMSFIMGVVQEPFEFFSYFFNLPLILIILFLFYFFFTELVFFCTLLSTLPFIKEKMIEKYNDPLILKKRGYNTYSSTLRRMITLGVPIAAAIIVGGDTIQNSQSINAIIESNEKVWEHYRLTKDKRLLEHLQKIPTDRFTTKIQEVSVEVRDFFVKWAGGSSTKD